MTQEEQEKLSELKDGLVGLYNSEHWNTIKDYASVQIDAKARVCLTLHPEKDMIKIAWNQGAAVEWQTFINIVEGVVQSVIEENKKSKSVT